MCHRIKRITKEKPKSRMNIEEELRKEIENQKLLFELKAQNKKTSRKKGSSESLSV